MTADQTIRATAEIRDSLKFLKFRIAADIGRDFSLGELIGILVTVGEKHHAEVVRLARERIK